MVKVSITLPNNAQITFESEEPEVAHQIAAMVLRDLPRDLMGSIVAANGDSVQSLDSEKGTGVVDSTAAGAAQPGQLPNPASAGVSGAEKASSPPSPPQVASTASGPARGPSRRPSATEVTETQRPNLPAGAEEALVDFCRSAAPLGDMRRAVAAAEGARRFLAMESVDADDLERLFDLAGWRRPHSMIQTLRNSARSKFQWLERVPGRSGQYTVTDLGRSVILGK